MIFKKAWFCTTLLTLLLIAASQLSGGSVFAASYSLTVNGSVKQGAVPHFWSECVGTGTMEYCLKPAWRNAARIGAREAGFKLVRGHGILVHINNVDNILLGSYPNWNFSAIDQIYDTVIACGMKPIVELDFMPSSLQSNGPTSPPKDFSVWKHLIASLVRHLQARYGAEEVRTWYFEVWNEFDYPGFWKSDTMQYNRMYDSAAAGVKSVDTAIKVGGPATTNSDPLNGFWKSCNQNQIDFLSNHQYGVGRNENYSQPVNIRNDNRARSDIIKKTGKKLLSFNTEYNSSYSGAGGNAVPNCNSMDNHRNAPFVTKTVKLIIDDCKNGAYQYPDVLSYWAISDCFDEWWGNNNNSYIEGNSYVPFGQVFGLINYQGIRKATFNAFAMLHKMGTIGLQLTGGSGDADGVDGFATQNEQGTQVGIIVYSYYDDLTTTGADDNVNLVINNLPFATGTALTVNHYRVDSLRSNPYGVWKRLGSPKTPSAAEWDSLRAHHYLETIEPQSTIQYTGAPISRSIAMPRWSVSLLTISGQATGTEIPGRARFERPLFTLSGTHLTVSPRSHEQVTVSIFGPNGRLIKQVRSLQRSVDLGDGLARGVYYLRADGKGMRFMRKIAVY